MNRKIKVDQIPSNADELYIQLYCERKGENNERTKEQARTSWNSLRSSKKKLFQEKTTERNLLNYVHGLRKCKIYMKEKFTTCDNSPIHENEEHHGDDHITTSICHDSSPLHENEENTERQHIALSSINGSTLTEHRLQTVENASVDENVAQSSEDNELMENRTKNDAETQSNASSHQRDTIPLIEPSPPTVKIGKDLYEVIKRPGQPNWIELPPLKRRYYNEAVRRLKIEYIKKYTNYLESLSQQQLFDHYMKTLH